MKPFSAWLAMKIDGEKQLYSGFDGSQQREYALAYVSGGTSSRETPVLIIEDTEETRRKLGMEEV